MDIHVQIVRGDPWALKAWERHIIRLLGPRKRSPDNLDIHVQIVWARLEAFGAKRGIVCGQSQPPTHHQKVVGERQFFFGPCRRAVTLAP